MDTRFDPVGGVRRLRGALCGLLCLLGVVGTAHAQSATRTLQSIDATTLPGNEVMLTLSLSDTPPKPVVFTVEQPARLSLDLPDTSIALTNRFQKVNLGAVRAVSVGEARGRTRVVIELGQIVPYAIETVGNQLRVRINNSGPTATMTTADAGSPVEKNLPTTPDDVKFMSVDFRRSESGAGRVTIDLSNPHAMVDVSEKGEQIVARFRNTKLPALLQRRLDVIDFATPVKYVDTEVSGTDVVVTVTPIAGANFEHLAYQAGNQFMLELQPVATAKNDKDNPDEKHYKGERISLSFQSVDVRALLQIIADIAGTNLVVSDSVTGQVAMRLENVPWDQALDIILRSKGLGMRQDGNVMIVAPLTELAQRDQAELEAQKQVTELAPLRSELIQINYAKASDIAALLKSSDSSMLSSRGRVTVDARTNTLLLMETREKISEIRSLISQLDIPVRQVLIESRIVIASTDYSRELGSRFGVSAVGTNGNNGLVTTSGTLEATDTTVSSYTSGDDPVSLGDLSDRYNVSLPASGSAGSIAVAVLGSDYLVDMELSALQAEGRGEVVSTPRVTTANGKEASIEQGTQIPYSQSSSSGATTVSFKDAVLSLTVTPQITPDDRIAMDLKVNNDSVGETVTTSTGGSVPSIDTRKVSTHVLVDNGQTVVLGGIYQETNSDSVTKIPLLGDIPLLGVLFRNKTVEHDKDELLIFVTPKILKDSLTLR